MGQLAAALAQDPFTACLRAEILLARGDWATATSLLAGAVAAVTRHGNVMAQTWTERLLQWSFVCSKVARVRPSSDCMRCCSASNCERRHTSCPTLRWRIYRAGRYRRGPHGSQRGRQAGHGRMQSRNARRRLAGPALIALQQGELLAAARALDAGLDLARGMPYPHGEGRLLDVYGRLHLVHGDAAAARERLEAALAIFHRLGARKDAEHAEHLLTMC